MDYSDFRIVLNARAKFVHLLHVKLIASTCGSDENRFNRARSDGCVRDARNAFARRLPALCFRDQRMADLRPVRALLIGHLHVSIRDDANGIDSTLTYISIAFTGLAREREKVAREREREKI